MKIGNFPLFDFQYINLFAAGGSIIFEYRFPFITAKSLDTQCKPPAMQGKYGKAS